MAHSNPIISSSFRLQVLPRNFSPATIQPSLLTVASKSSARSTNIRCQAITNDANTLSSLISDLDKNQVAQESNQQHGHFPDEQVAARWREIHGCNNWYGLLDPMDPVLRTELIRYGEFTQATYDGFDYDPLSPNCGSSKYPHNNFFEGLGINGIGYDVTRFLYATAHFKLPNFGISSRHPEKWSNRACWVGFVAVSGDEATKRLGRRDIVVAWRGTVTQLEWVADLMSYLQPLVGKGISCPDAAAKVEAGFLEYYAEKDPSCEYCKYSAREQVLTEVKKLIDLYSKAGEEVSISITGHSLGSALAMLSAYDIAETGVNLRPSGERVSTCVISFAGPRLGNQRFKKRFDNLGIKALRVVNVHDGVPKIPGLVLNEKFPEFMRKVGVGLPESYIHIGEVGVGLPESYIHIGEELLLDNTHSPYLKETSDPAALHNMEVYLHLIDGYHGKGTKFELATRRDIALVNKTCDFLKDEYLIPPSWRQDENKGMIKTADGRWVLEERPIIACHPDVSDEYLSQLGLVTS